MEINIGFIYPELLNMYGDKGNITALKKRCEWRDIKANVFNISLYDEVKPMDYDIIVIGGGSLKDEILAREKLMSVREELKNYVEENKVLLGVCGGFEILGNYYYRNGEKQKGLSLVDMETKKGDKRFIGNIVIDTPFGKVCGFYNHSSKTYIGCNTPLGNVLVGVGNNNEDTYEGVIYKNLFGTYIHGPLLPKNPNITDELIKRALKKKYDFNEELLKLDDKIEDEAKDYIIKRYIK